MNDHWMAIIITFIVFGSLTSIAVMWFLIVLKRSHHKHEEIMSFIEKGEFDPTILEYDAKYRKHRYLLRAGILFAIGISVIGCLLALPFDIAPQIVLVTIVGIIPIVVGFGFLLYYFILRRNEEAEETLNSDES